MCRTFEDLLATRKNTSGKRMAVVWAAEAHVLTAVTAAYEDAGIQPILIGQSQDIRQLMDKLSIEHDFTIVAADTPEQAVKIAVDMVRAGQADIIFKGLLQTATIMRAIVNKDAGICRSGVLSHVSLLEIPGYHKLVALTDGALLTYPSLEKKAALLQNAVHMMHSIGVNEPKVAVLAAVENVNPKMPETVDADALKTMWQEGCFDKCIVEGPISYDLAMDPEAAATKHYESPVAGDADILVVPNIQAGNMLIKSLVYSAHARCIGLVIGAQVPVVITSRSAPTANKSLAIRVAAALENI